MAEQTEPTCKLQVYLWTQEKADLIAISDSVTIKDIINYFEGDENNIVAFTDSDIKYQTPIIDFTKTLVDYNMWHPNEKSYIAQLHLFHKKDTHLYNKERYNMYSNTKQ